MALVTLSLIDASFFVRDIYLTNLDKAPHLSRLDLFINKREPECLMKILGAKLYKLLTTEDSQRIHDLVDGVGYFSPSNFERYWQGLVHDDDQSLIANYVYYYFQEALALQTTDVATKASKAEAAESASPADKMVNAWRFFASETRDLCSFLWNKRVNDEDNGDRIYPEFEACHWHNTMNIARKGGVNKYGF